MILPLLPIDQTGIDIARFILATFKRRHNVRGNFAQGLTASGVNMLQLLANRTSQRDFEKAGLASILDTYGQCHPY